MSYNSTAKTEYLKSSTVSNDSCKAENVSVASSVITMTVGIVSNTLALFILLKAYQRLRKKSNAYFLLFASGLVMTDFLGHLINGSLALYVYALNKEWESFDPNQVLCGVFGICMSFFGLSPLLLGGIMAVERCIGVTHPLFHTTVLTSYHIHRLLALNWILALLVALLPVLVWRPYQVQGSRSWCFYRLVGLHDWLDMLLPMIFSMLGLLALLISLVCNTVTGFTLLWTKMHCELDYHCSRRKSLHFEMICQLLAIMMVSCICWGPFLVRTFFLLVPWKSSSYCRYSHILQIIFVTIFITSFQQKGEDACSHLLLTVHLATWNQILDPWVYILLRKAVLKRLCLLAQRLTGPCLKHEAKFRWRFSSMGSSVKASSSVSSRPDLDGPFQPGIYLDGPFQPGTHITTSRNYT
ncbi:prostaglandin F2-alpha receptor [Tachysurus fulvidraco]|uniref:prostaglandin F2-alpha receptor n=1 Tax=Tachysurus fulvidraco TaxID=1234273 RepID=UPI001FEEE14A|nr:prostaglandin F2-alpha receptor [Tachysurus fulvidraco]